MRITVQRTEFTDKSTIGQMLIDGVFFCHTLEDRDRGLEIYQMDSVEAADHMAVLKAMGISVGPKVPEETAIPRCSVRLVLSKSKRFGEVMPLLIDVDQFTGVRIHRGNHDGNTEGCILVGEYTEGVPDWIGNSRVTFAKLMNKLQDAHDDGERIILEVV